MNSSELKVDVPLAVVESDCEDAYKSQDNLDDYGDNRRQPLSLPPKVGSTRSSSANRATARKASPRFNIDMGSDSVTGSLEDLVSTFDEKLTVCFSDFKEEVEKIAPVQVRTQEEIMNECQVWWTITGNFGNMMPIDWSKSTTRAKTIPTLNLCAPRNHSVEEDNLEEEDDMVAADLDMHSLILSSNPEENSEPVKTADEVIKEIDDIIECSEKDEDEDVKPNSESLPRLPDSLSRSRHIVAQALQGRKLEELGVNELTQIYCDIELLVRELSEELVSDLGVRDELEYEKELKNQFISLLLSIQSKRRQFCGPETKSPKPTLRLGSGAGATKEQYKYLTTVIPYQPERGAPPVSTLQVLVKILKAINEDSPAVPALLTDYILKVLCPS